MLPANTGIHVLRYPTGRYGFVGRVPAVLAFESTHAGDLDVARQSGPGFARKIAERNGRTFDTRTFADAAEAIAFAAANGFTVVAAGA